MDNFSCRQITGVALWLGCVAAMLVQVGNAQETSESEQSDEPADVQLDRRPDRMSGPQCGIYCMYGALRGLGKTVDLKALLNSKYISSSEGSSIADLRRA